MATTAKTGLWSFEEFVSIDIEIAYEVSSYRFPGEPKDWAPRTRWRKANPIDMAAPEFRWLFDRQGASPRPSRDGAEQSAANRAR